MWAINFMLIKGFMVGMEYDTHEDGMFTVVLDLGFFRFCYYTGPEELFDE